MTGFRVVGLDLSLTSSGMSDGRQHSVVQTTSDCSLEYRLHQIVQRTRRFVIETADWPQEAGLVVIEAGAFSRGAQSAAAEHLAALRIMVRHAMWCLEVPFAMVTPTGLKAYTTGHGQATKQRMVAAVAERHGVDLSSVKVKDGRYDMADAFALAAMGYAWAGRPLTTEGPPAPHASMLAVQWPSAAHPDQPVRQQGSQLLTSVPSPSAATDLVS